MSVAKSMPPCGEIHAPEKKCGETDCGETIVNCQPHIMPDFNACKEINRQDAILNRSIKLIEEISESSE